MTREEAIEELQGCIIAEEHGKDGKPNGNVTCELTKGTIDLAIKALEQLPKLQNRCHALTQGQMCFFCPYECEHRAEIEPQESEDKG